MQNLRVLQIIPNFGIGGAEKVVLNYLKYNTSNSMHVKAVSLYPKQDTLYDAELEQSGCDVEYLNKKMGMDFSVVPQLKKVIQAYDPHVIHTHLYTLKYLALTGEMKGRKIFHTIHNEPDHDGGKFDVWCNRHYFKLGKVVPITLQDRLAESVNQFYGIDGTKVIRNGICLKDYSKKNAYLKKELNIPQHAYVIGHIGRMAKQKNHEFLLKIFQQVVKQSENAVLLLIGSGEEEKSVRQLVAKLRLEDRVWFLGNRSDISELLNIMDVFCFPSLYEGLGIVLVEAQAAGLPCVVSDRIPKEVLLTDRIEQLSLGNSPEIWCEKLLHPEYLHNDEVYEKLDNYDISKTLWNLENVYRESEQV